jgi:hypothetical protein
MSDAPKGSGVEVRPVDGSKPPEAEYKDSTPKGWKIRGTHKPGSWVVHLGAGGNGEEAEAYRRGYDAIDWKRGAR